MDIYLKAWLKVQYYDLLQASKTESYHQEFQFNLSYHNNRVPNMLAAGHVLIIQTRIKIWISKKTNYCIIVDLCPMTYEDLSPKCETIPLSLGPFYPWFVDAGERITPFLVFPVPEL
jgi:hypothetical protein